jgi:hypothetical protein
VRGPSGKGFPEVGEQLLDQQLADEPGEALALSLCNGLADGRAVGQAELGEARATLTASMMGGVGRVRPPSGLITRQSSAPLSP